jgi:hypothetical protein
MERRTRRNHFPSAALSITDDLLHRNILLLRARTGRQASTGFLRCTLSCSSARVARGTEVAHYSAMAARAGYTHFGTKRLGSVEPLRLVRRQRIARCSRHTNELDRGG